MTLRASFAAVLVGMLAVAAPAARVDGPVRTFERTFAIAGPITLDAITRTGAVRVRTGEDGSVVVRGRVTRAVSWRGAQVSDAEIERLQKTPPVRASGDTVRIEQLDQSLWRSVNIDYEIVVPAAATVLVSTDSGAVSVAGSRGEVRAGTRSGAIDVDAEAGKVDLQSGSGRIRVTGAMAALAVATQSGAISAETRAVDAVEASSGSGSVTISGVQGSARAETGSSQIRLDGRPAGDWHVRSRSGSVEMRVPANAPFDVLAKSRSGNVAVAHTVAASNAVTKHHVEGSVNGGGPKIDVETGSSAITLR